MPNTTKENQHKLAQEDAIFLLKALQQSRTPVLINIASIIQPGQKVNTIQKKFNTIKQRNGINITTTAAGYTATALVQTPPSQHATSTSSSSMRAINWYPPAINNNEDHSIEAGISSAPPRKSPHARKPISKKRRSSAADSDQEITSDRSPRRHVLAHRLENDRDDPLPSDSDFADLNATGPRPLMTSPKRRKRTVDGKPVARKGSDDADADAEEDWC